MPAAASRCVPPRPAFVIYIHAASRAKLITTQRCIRLTHTSLRRPSHMKHDNNTHGYPTIDRFLGLCPTLFAFLIGQPGAASACFPPSHISLGFNIYRTIYFLAIPASTLGLSIEPYRNGDFTCKLSTSRTELAVIYSPCFISLAFYCPIPGLCAYDNQRAIKLATRMAFHSHNE